MLLAIRVKNDPAPRERNVKNEQMGTTFTQGNHNAGSEPHWPLGSTIVALPSSAVALAPASRGVAITARTTAPPRNMTHPPPPTAIITHGNHLIMKDSFGVTARSTRTVDGTNPQHPANKAWKSVHWSSPVASTSTPIRPMPIATKLETYRRPPP